MRNLTLVTVAVLSLCSAPLAATAQDGYYSGKAVFLPDSVNEVFRGGSFRIEVTRAVSNAEERELLERAERLFPARSAIEKAASAMDLPMVSARLQTAASLPGDRWWWDSADWFLTPYALTGAAVQHYVEKMRIMAADPVQIGPYAPPHGLVRYTARVVRSQNESGGREVEMQLRVEVTCGARCGLYFSHSRVVVFDKNNVVVRVRGDGPPRMIAS